MYGGNIAVLFGVLTRCSGNLCQVSEVILNGDGLAILCVKDQENTYWDFYVSSGTAQKVSPGQYVDLSLLNIIGVSDDCEDGLYFFIDSIHPIKSMFPATPLNPSKDLSFSG